MQEEFDTERPKKELQDDLTSILSGATRIPTLLINDPTQPLSSLHLEDYTVLDCEPLHALKGHLANLFEELPYISNGKSCEDLVNLIKANFRKDKVTGADYRKTAIQAYSLLQKTLPSGNEILLLMETAVKMSQMLYAEDHQRSSKTILLLYNSTWYHHELCSKLFTTTKSITRRKLFGSYLHDLSTHAALQYEIVCLRSTNTENQEQIFQQAKHIAERTTNRQPDNVITNILVRLQAKQKLGTLLGSMTQQDSMVKRAAAGLKAFGPTKFPKTFIAERTSSWQAHMERISHYLLEGEGIWWKETAMSSSMERMTTTFTLQD